VNTDGMTHAQVEAKGVEWAVELLSTWLARGDSTKR
jgi:hypothetical protein